VYYPENHTKEEPVPTLYEKIHGCNAAAVVSNSMGDVTEGKSYQEIESRYGRLETLVPQDIQGRVREAEWGPDWVRHAHHRPPGMTEDGIERHRLMCTAIIEKGGRVDVWDLARVWVRDINPDHFGYLLGNQDQIFYYLLKAGMPPTETGRHAVWPGFIGTAKMMLPVGLINAGDPRQAARDALDLGRLKDTAHRAQNFALEVCAGLAAACAEAMRPQATIESVIAEGVSHLSSTPRAAVEQALGWAEEVDEVWDLRPLFQEKYEGHRASNAVEVFSAGLSIFSLVGQNTRDAIIAGVNFGRDCDCISYVAAGLAGAMNGIDSVPTEWVETVEEELRSDPYTVSTRSLEDTAQGLYGALLQEMEQAKQRIAELETQQ
jgi:ADP-ribosylglycohydrolase